MMFQEWAAQLTADMRMRSFMDMDMENKFSQKLCPQHCRQKKKEANVMVEMSSFY